MSAEQIAPLKKESDIDYTGFTTLAQAEEYDKMFGRKYVQIDTATGKPLESAKDFFYEIMSSLKNFLGSGSENAIRIEFVIQKFWRNKTYKVPSSPDSHSRRDVIKHLAYSEQNSEGEMTAEGSRIIDAEKFKRQFKEDTTI